jgi:hypothetical protein
MEMVSTESALGAGLEHGRDSEVVLGGDGRSPAFSGMDKTS